MASEIELSTLKRAVNAVLDHLMEDLGLDRVAIADGEDFYWECSPPELYDTSRKPSLEDTGRLSDDMGFVREIQRAHSADASYNLVHVAPLLRYIGEKIKK